MRGVIVTRIVEIGAMWVLALVLICVGVWMLAFDYGQVEIQAGDLFSVSGSVGAAVIFAGVLIIIARIRWGEASSTTERTEREKRSTTKET